MAHGGNVASIHTKWETILWALGGIAFPLGVYGFWQYDLEHGGTGTIFDWAYHTLQLFILHGVHLEHPAPPALHLARFLAPAFTVYSLYWGLRQAFQEPFRTLRLWVIRKHVVIVGDGSLALRIATDLYARGKQVVTVGSEARRETFLSLRRKCIYVSSDMAPELPFDKLRAHKSQQIILAARDDQSNIGTAVRLIAFLSGRERKEMLPPCHVHLFDLYVRQLFIRYRLFERNPGARRLSTFNIYDNCARHLLERCPLDRITIGADSELVVRLVVIGFGKMGESLVLQAAKLGHFANGHPLEIVVFDQEADEREASFRYRYPHFSKICAIEFRRQDLRKPQTIQDLARLLEDQSRVQTLAFCINNESLNVPVALGLFTDLYNTNVPALVRTASAAGLAKLLDTPWDGVPLAQTLHPFNVLDTSVSQHFLEGSKQDNLARAIHEDFRERRRSEGRREDDPSMQPWEILGPDFKESNRRQADHIRVKLRAIGCTTSSTGGTKSPLLQPFQDFTPSEVDILAQMEHASWNAERFLAGWNYGPNRSERDRTSPYLVSWEQLPDEVQEWDREAVRNIPPLLARSGESISR